MHLRASIKKAFNELENAFSSEKTRSIDYRKAQIYSIIQALDENEETFVNAMTADFKEKYESITEVKVLITACYDTIDNLSSWAAPVKVSPGIPYTDKAAIQSEPKGVALIIAPWNYPLILTIRPLISAIAAGCCVMVKPSEKSVFTSKAMLDIFSRYLDPSCVKFILGGIEESNELLQLPFNHIFFTGSERVGKIVYKAAAEQLIPCTLELGGKCPVIVSSRTNLEVAANRIIWGKTFNAGQTCLAPDYILCTNTTADLLIPFLRSAICDQFGNDPKESQFYTKIVDEEAVDRLASLLEEVSKNIVIGGTFDRASRYVAPTVLSEVSTNAKIMKEEIFGPLLPIVIVNDLEEAISFVNSRPKPLALYLFSTSKGQIKDVVSRTSSGSVCVNDIIMQNAGIYS